MSNQEILEKAISRAIKNGWKDSDEYEEYKPISVGEHVFLTKSYTSPNIFFDVKELIFNHDFAKALWLTEPDIDAHIMPPIRPSAFKEQPTVSVLVEYKRYPAWQYHLQQMVIAPDLIAYLGENI